MGDIQNTQKKTYIMALDQGTTLSLIHISEPTRP